MWEEPIDDFPALIILEKLTIAPQPLHLRPCQNDETAQNR
jgi:hypothetical protein